MTAPTALRGKIETVLITHNIAPDPGLVDSLLAVMEKPSKAPPAAERYRYVFQRYPGKEFWEGMGQAIGEEPAALDLWEAHCRAWHNRGYNPRNYQGLFDSFKNGGLDERNRTNKTGDGKIQSRLGLIGNSLSDEGLAWANAAAKHK